MTSLDEVSTRIGSLEATNKHLDKRLDTLDEKLDKMIEKFAVIDHMRRNLAMMKAPVEDYQQMKQRGTGMWMLVTFLLGGATVAFNIISYVVRVWVLKIGG